MDTKIKPAKEIVVTAPDNVGVLSKVAAAVAVARVNIRATCAYGIGGTAHVRMITDDNGTAIKALNTAGFKAEEHDVLITELAPHFLHPDIAGLSGAYEVESNFWCASAHSGEHALLIFSPKGTLKAAGVR